MRSLEQIGAELFVCSLSWEPEARVVGNVTALELAMIACSRLVTCPTCGAEAGVNVDCHTCAAIESVERLTETAPPKRG